MEHPVIIHLYAKELLSLRSFFLFRDFHHFGLLQISDKQISGYVSYRSGNPVYSLYCRRKITGFMYTEFICTLKDFI